MVLLLVGFVSESAPLLDHPGYSFSFLSFLRSSSFLVACGSELEPHQRLEAMLGLRIKMAGDGRWVCTARWSCVALGLVPLCFCGSGHICCRFHGCVADARAERSICSELVLNPPGGFESLMWLCVEEGFIYSLCLCFFCGKKILLYRVFSSSIT